MAKRKSLDTLPIDDLILDHELQMRADGVDEGHAGEMVDAAKDGSLPRLSVMRVQSVGNIVTDGWNRIRAYQMAGLTSVPVDITDGSLVDAQIACAKANRENLSKPRSRADKIRAIEMLFAALAQSKQDWTDRRISEELAVSRDLVKKVRGSLAEADEPESIPLPETKRVGADNKQYPTPEVKKKEVVPTISSYDAWDSTPITEFLNCDNFVQGALDRSKVKTAGELLKRLDDKETFGLPVNDLYELRRQVEEMRDAELAVPRFQEPKAKVVGAPKGFDHAAFDRSVQHIATAIDEFATLHPDDTANERNHCHKLINEMLKVWKAWVQKAGK